MATYVIGDIHGRLVTFISMLDKLKLDKERDTLYLLGDYTDSGPDGIGVIQHIMNMQDQGFKVHCLMGNHDKMMLDVIDYQGDSDEEYQDRQVVSSLGAVPVTFIYDLGQVPQKKSSKNKAQQVIKDQKETYALLSKAVTHAKEVPGLGPYLADIPLLCSMIYDYAKGQYREVPIGTIIGCTAALIYFVSPIDMIPDFIPVVGQLDDVGVLVYALKAVHQDLQEYNRWKQGKVIQHAGA